MNIKSVNGKVIHVQKNGHRTICGRSLTIRCYNRQTGLFESKSYYIETDEVVNCEKCKNQIKT